MTVPVTAADPAIVLTLQQTIPRIPFEEISRIVYNTYVPGRFGKIHTGRWRDEDVELKQPSGDHATIEKEVRLLHKLRHCPQILRLFGFTVEPSTSIAYLIVQHNEHGTLHSYLLNFHPHLTWPDRYNLALDIALGLRYLHHKGCRHRHLHSASVLIDTNGSAMLSDFGNSKDSEVISSREHTTRMAYLAPERLSKSGVRYAVECDIYSLGVVFWEISSGRPPYNELITLQNIQNGALNSLAQNIVSGRRERPVSGTDPMYEDLYTRCWHPDPQERPTLDWIIQTLGVLLKQPSGFILRQLDELSIEDDEVPQAMTPFGNTSKALDSVSRGMSINVGHAPSHDYDRDPKYSLTRSRELTISPREPDYPPPPPAMPPPIPPVSQRRKLSAATSFAPPARSMSISSGSSSGSSSGAVVPVLPTRDARRVSTVTGLYSSAEIPQYNVLPKRRSPQTIWEACQEGNADLAEWHILTTGTSPDGLVSLPAYSMLAEVGPIHVVCFYQPDTILDVLKTLQRNGANMDLRTTLTSQSALHVVLEHATNYNLALEVVKYLMLECKLSVNEPDNRGLTPFHKYIKNPYLSDIVSVAASEMYSLLREKGQANLSMESHHEGNALGMTARYLRVDIMKLFLLTDLSCSEPRSLSYANNAVEAPLSESRSSKSAQDLCRTVLAEWKGERGEKKRIAMAERTLEHQGIPISSVISGSIASSPALASASVFTGPSSKGKKQGGLLGLGKSGKDAALGPLPPKVASEVDVAMKVLQSTSAKQRQLKNLIADSGF